MLAMLVSRASAIRLSLQPSPASDTSAFNRIRAFEHLGGTLAFADQVVERVLSSALRRTTYFLTAASFTATNHLR